MPIDSKHPEYKLNASKWLRCRHSYEGEDAIKSGGVTYLPKLSGQDDNQYKAYKERGMFYSAMSRTVDGLVGMITSKDPIVKVPAKMEEYLDDITFTGIDINEYIKLVASELLLTSRYGIAVDRDIDGSRPFLIGRTAEECFNWTESVGDLDLIVLDSSEYVPSSDDPYKMEIEKKIIEYKFIDNAVHAINHVFDHSTKAYRAESPIMLLNKGIGLDFIPFNFVNIIDTSTKVTKPPLIDLVNVNISHWKNSVDLEHGRHWTAIPTPWVSGLTSSENELKVGGETAWLLPKDAKAGFLEFTGTGLAALERALESKEKMMAVLGARMLESQKRAAESAETSRMNRSGDVATLSSIANATANGIEAALKNMAKWEGLDESKVSVEINSDFIDEKIDPQMLTALVQSWQSGAISHETFFYNVSRADMIPDGVDFESEKVLIDNSSPSLTGTPDNLGNV